MPPPHHEPRKHSLLLHQPSDTFRAAGFVFLSCFVAKSTTPQKKSRRTTEAVCVTKFRNRMRKSVTFCRKCGRKIPPEKASSRLLFVGSPGVAASAGLPKSSTCPFCKASRFAAMRSNFKTHPAPFCLQRSVRGAGTPYLAPCCIFLFTYSLDYFAAI